MIIVTYNKEWNGPLGMLRIGYPSNMSTRAIAAWASLHLGYLVTRAPKKAREKCICRLLGEIITSLARTADILNLGAEGEAGEPEWYVYLGDTLRISMGPYGPLMTAEEFVEFAAVDVDTEEFYTGNNTHAAMASGISSPLRVLDLDLIEEQDE